MILKSTDQNIWFTSDTHFQHKNILLFSPKTRKGNDINEHDEILIDNWNTQVYPNDLVFHLGDVAFAKPDKMWKILDRLTGKIVLVKGNHDKVILRNQNLQERFKSIHSDLTVYIDNQMVVLYHFPIAEHDQMHRGAFHFYGHVHGNKVPGMKGRTFDVGIDNRPDGDMLLWSWEELRDMMLLLPFGDRTRNSE